MYGKCYCESFINKLNNMVKNAKGNVDIYENHKYNLGKSLSGKEVICQKKRR